MTFTNTLSSPETFAGPKKRKARDEEALLKQEVTEDLNQWLDLHGGQEDPSSKLHSENSIGNVETGDADQDDDDNAKNINNRRKIRIEYISDRSKRHITFSKRKFGIMKKAFELHTLTGTQVLLVIASETGHVYSYATDKLEPVIKSPEGQAMIQKCLNGEVAGSSKATADVISPQVQATSGSLENSRTSTREVGNVNIPPFDDIFDAPGNNFYPQHTTPQTSHLPLALSGAQYYQGYSNAHQQSSMNGAQRY